MAPSWRLRSRRHQHGRAATASNIKEQKFSWADLEALITSPKVSGHQMHKGEAQRPNTLIWVLTLNGARLSRDMAQRCIIVKLQRPEYSPTWEAETREYIETNRWQIISDIGMALTGSLSTSETEGDSSGSILPMGGVGSSSPGKSGPRRKGSGTLLYQQELVVVLEDELRELIEEGIGQDQELLGEPGEVDDSIESLVRPLLRISLNHICFHVLGEAILRQQGKWAPSKVRPEWK